MTEFVENILQRNARVDADKAWETSWTRKVIITAMTYVVVVLYLTVLGMERVYLHALVPAGGYFLSTLSLPLFKRLCMDHLYLKKMMFCFTVLFLWAPATGHAQELLQYEERLPELDRSFLKEVLDLHVASAVVEILVDEQGLFDVCHALDPAFASGLIDQQKTLYFNKAQQKTDVIVNDTKSRETILIWEKLEAYFNNLTDRHGMSFDDFRAIYMPQVDKAIENHDLKIKTAVREKLYDTDRCESYAQLIIKNETPSYLNSAQDLLQHLQANHFKSEKYKNYGPNITALLSSEAGAE